MCSSDREQVQSLIKRIGPHHREHIIADEFFAQVINEDMLGLDAHQFSLLASWFQFLALPQIGGTGQHFAALFLLSPLQDRSEERRIGKECVMTWRYRGSP